jgi:hypothetical protein
MDPRIADYIARNRGKYTREAIRQQLIDAGHDPADIDATWAILDTPDPDEAALAGEGFWPRFFLFLIGLNVAVFLLVALSTGMLQALTSTGGVLAGVFAVALGIGALIAWAIVAAVGPAKLGRTTAIVIGGVIPIVFALLIGGSCYALAGSIPPPPVSGEMVVQIDEVPFQGTGPATCQPSRGAIGYGVYSENLGRIEGRQVFVSVDSYEAEPGDRVTNVSISAQPTAEADPPLDWFNSPDTRIQADVAVDGLSGMVTFEGLTPGIHEPAASGTDADAISGTIRWSCGESAP